MPLFIISYALMQIDFTILWRYFSWANQSTAAIALWVGAMYLVLAKRNHWIASIPATFMTMVTFTYIANAPIGFGLPMNVSYFVAAIGTVLVVIAFVNLARKQIRKRIKIDEDINDKAA